jgi:hypothetical protein
LKRYSSLNIIELLGFECTADDHAFTEAVKKIPVEPGLEEVVFIDDTAMKRKQIDCLFHLDAWINDDVFIDDIAVKRKQIHYLFHSDAWINDDVMISSANLL